MASKASIVRIVRCPKCRKLLPEFANFPVYTCGGCGAVLRAKNQHANKGNGASQMLAGISSDKKLPQHVSENGGTSNDATLMNEDAAFSINAKNTEMDHVGEHKHIGVPSDKTSCSNSQSNCHKEESSKCTKDANTEIGTTDETSALHPWMVGNDVISVSFDQQGRSIQVNMNSCSNEQLDDCCKHSESGSANSHSACKIESTGSSVSEDIVDGDPGNILCERMSSPTAVSTHDYNGTVSSYDEVPSTHGQDLLSSRTVSNKTESETKNTTEKFGVKDTSLESVDGCLKPHLESGVLSSKSSYERCGSDLNQTSTSNDACCQELFQDPEIFYSARKELEDDILSRSLSRELSSGNLPYNVQNGGSTGFGNPENDRVELLRKVDELRDHLTRPYVQGREGNRRFHIPGTRQDSHRPSFYNHEPEHVLRYCNSNITQSHFKVFGQRAIAQRYQSLTVPYSGQGNSSCLHHHPEDWCIPVQLPPNIYCKACACHFLSYSPTAACPQCCEDCNVALCSHDIQTSAQHPQKLRYKDKRQQPLKRHCRPVFGGAPFVICNKCSQLLQLPADFLVSRARCHKLKCGACSEILVFLSHSGCHMVPHSSNQLDPAPSEVEDATEPVGRHELSDDHPYDCLRGDPVSYSEEYGPPFSNDYSTDGDPLPHILGSSSEREGRRRGKQTIGSPLHSLMGYASASELIYQPNDEDEGYESADIVPFSRTSDGMHFDEARQRPGMDSPLQEHSEIRCASPEQTEIHEEDRYVERPSGARGGPPLRGFFKKGTKELNHGLENLRLKVHTSGRVHMKLKAHTSGRVIPAP